MAVFKSFYTIARGLFHNRWCGDLAPDYAEWSRPADHPTVFTADLSTQALQTQLFAVLLGPGMTPPTAWLPGESEHQNTLPPRNTDQ